MQLLLLIAKFGETVTEEMVIADAWLLVNMTFCGAEATPTALLPKLKSPVLTLVAPPVEAVPYSGTIEGLLAPSPLIVRLPLANPV
jgi:hypothetical protein